MLGIVFLKGQYSVAWGVQGALALLASLPTLIVFLFFQRYFIRGLTMGAVKG
jgi:ABC-type glycerol-3-phosphate transport system permease component